MLLFPTFINRASSQVGPTFSLVLRAPSVPYLPGWAHAYGLTCVGQSIPEINRHLCSMDLPVLNVTLVKFVRRPTPVLTPEELWSRLDIAAYGKRIRWPYSVPAM